MRHRSDSINPVRAAFTLIELLVVVIIIVILVGIVAGVGAGLARDSRGQLTRDLFKTLDRMVTEYEAATGNIPTYPPDSEVASTYSGVPGPDNTDIVDYGGREGARRPDAAVFLKQASGVGVIDDIASSIPARFLVTTITSGDPDPTPSIVDAWSKKDWDAPYPVKGQTLVYYIHPSNKFAQALYGRCINGRPYFLSAGPDNLYGTTRDDGSPTEDEAEQALEDNITSYAPGPPNLELGGLR